MRTAKESYLNWSRLLPKKTLPTRRSSFPAVLALSPSRWPIGLTQLIEFVRVAGATEVEVLIPTGGGMFAEGAAMLIQRNVRHRHAADRAAKGCAHRFFCPPGERQPVRQRKTKR